MVQRAVYQIELTKKNILLLLLLLLLLSDAVLILYGARLHLVKKDKSVQFTLSSGTYSIDDLNAKIKVTVLK